MDTDVTVAVLSAIEPPLPECLAAVEAQEGGPYRIVHVKDCFPMSRAFNEMILQSAPSKYVVQVDGDVVLQPWAVQHLHEAIQKTWWCYMAWGQLWEVGFGLGGSVRIWRRWPVRLLGFRDVRCVDRDLHNRISLLGMCRLPVDAGEPFGTHFPRQIAFARFSKSKGDALKWLHLGRTDLHEEFKARLFLKPKEQTFPERLGLHAASISGTQELSKNLQEDWWEYQRLCASYSRDLTFYTGAPSSRWL